MSSTPKTLTNNETWKLLDQLLQGFGSRRKKKKAVRNYTMAVLMLDAGLRVGEVVQLNVTDLWFRDFPVTSVLVRAEIAKNHEERQIPVSERLSNALKNMNESYWCHLGASGQHRAFHNSNSLEPLTTRQVERIIRAAAMKALGRPIHPHVLRHTFASNLMRITDMRTVQELLGHKHITSTQVYTHPNEEDKKKAINALPETLPCHHPLHQGLPMCPDAPNYPDAAGTDRDVR